MKLISVLAITALLASSLAVPAFAENKADRPGGYNEQKANLRSLASCVRGSANYDQWGNIVGYACN